MSDYGSNGQGGVRRVGKAFFAKVRHDLRTPINAIIGYSEMLLDEAEDENHDTLVPTLNVLRQSGETLLNLVNKLLDPVRLDAVSKELDYEIIAAKLQKEVAEPVRQVVEGCQSLAEECGRLDLEHLISDLEKIQGSGSRLDEQIKELRTLIRQETTRISPDKRSVRIPTDELPRKQVNEAVARVVAEQRETEVGSLLVVDDNETNRDMLSRRLVRDGHSVATAESGRQCLSMLRERTFDLVLLDMMMPEMDGYEVLIHMKSDPALRHIPVIMISALDEMDSVVKCIERGAEDYLPKPFDAVLLRARIGACLEKKRLRDREVSYVKQIEEEKKRSDELLHVIFPHEIVEELKRENTVKPRRYDNVAVLFCDIVGFTSYCDKHDPEDVIRPLSELVELFETLAREHGLEKIKTIGDSFMATAGMLKPVDNPALACVRCGLAMIQGAEELDVAWKVRVGVHIGPVVGGVVGASQYLFDLWGDTVNTAARMESNGVAGELSLSREAWDAVAELCTAKSRGLIDAKGKGQLEMYLIGGLREGG